MGPSTPAKPCASTSIELAAKTGAIRAKAVRELRVCHAVGCLRYGGAERQVVNLLNHLPLTKRFALLLGQPATEDLYRVLDERVTRDFVHVRLRRFPVDLVRVAQLLRRWRIDVLHTHMFWANLIGALAARLAGVPIVVTSEHGKNLWKGPTHRWIERGLISPLTDLRICASEDIQRLRQEGDGVSADKLIYIPNGTDLPELELRAQEHPPVIGTVGRFVTAKDYGTLIEAAFLLRASGVDFRLCLVGDGPERPGIERAISAQGLGAVVTLAGFQADVPAWLRSFDLFVMSSIREGQPLALLEAMAHGLPIVATRVGGIPSTVEDGAEATLVEPQRPQDLANALRHVLEDRRRQITLGANARRRAERDFSIQAVATRYAQTYQDLWQRKHETRA